MEGTGQRTLIIADGGLPALVAAAIEAERAVAEGGGGAVMLPWASVPAARAEQHAAVHSQARFFRFEIVEDMEPSGRGAGSSGAGQSQLLILATEAASRHGCDRVIWPVQFHSDHETIGGRIEEIAAAVDRTQLVGRLALLDTPAGIEPVRLDAPLVDLTDSQVADLVVDLDAPAYLAWWWRRLSDPGAELAAEGERRPWMAALHAAGWIRSEPRPAAPGGSSQDAVGANGSADSGTRVAGV